MTIWGCFLPWLMVSPPHSKVTKTSGWLKGRKIESITLLLLAPDFCISSSYCSAVKGSKISDIECGPITICHISSKHIPLHQLWGKGKGQQDTRPNLINKVKIPGDKKGITDASSSADCCLLLSIVDNMPQMLSLMMPQTYLSVSYLISSKRLLFKNIAHDGSFQHCTWLYLALPDCAWLYLALPWLAIIYLSTDCQVMPLTGLNAFYIQA